ncbi:cation diffusion facilitator family transporter [Sphingomonas flavescens]|uniref:cation diffusion facilitator family transporter n=1 Tax=Sphingomonas flavescens TaxID=3132797 RepID=UPI0028045CA6|nr:cation diffusion facilitator family transporter [Sphingomonas limnosediminicola]
MAHDHHHHHAPAQPGKAFAIGIGLNTAFVIIEAFYGFYANSMALVADAGHNLSDVLGLVVAWAGATMARKSATPRFTYGLKKASILSALINSLFLLVAVGAIGAEAIRRLFHPSNTNGEYVIAVAAVGIVINGLTAWFFSKDQHGDINVRGAYLHMLSDALVSLAVVFSGFVILWTGQRWVDPVMSLAVAVVILWGSIGLLKESVWMSLAGVPSGIDTDEVEAALAELPGVADVHHVHIWPLSTTETALTAHMVQPSGSADELINAAQHMLHHRFHIEHCTLQVERGHAGGGNCETEDC